jgi:dephospho-CoA kinase
VDQDGAEADARARLGLQIPDQEKAPRCDFVIDNSGSLETTRCAVEGIYRKLVVMARK